MLTKKEKKNLIWIYSQVCKCLCSLLSNSRYSILSLGIWDSF